MDEALLNKTSAHLRTAREQGGRGRPRPRTLRLAGACAALLVCVAGLLYFNMYVTAVAYVNMDVNPSVELTLNRMNRVIGSYAFNPKGEWLLQAVAVQGQKYDAAVAALVDTLKQDGYFNEDALVTLTVQTADAQREQVLYEGLRGFVVGQDSFDPAGAEVFPVSESLREEAYGCHMSPAKYLAIQELLEVDETATLDAYSDVSIGQIRQRTQQCREAHAGGSHGSASSGSGAGSGGYGNAASSDGSGAGSGGHGNAASSGESGAGPGEHGHGKGHHAGK